MDIHTKYCDLIHKLDPERYALFSNWLAIAKQVADANSDVDRLYILLSSEVYTQFKQMYYNSYYDTPNKISYSYFSDYLNEINSMKYLDINTFIDVSYILAFKYNIHYNDIIEVEEYDNVKYEIHMGDKPYYLVGSYDGIIIDTSHEWNLDPEHCTNLDLENLRSLIKFNISNSSTAWLMDDIYNFNFEKNIP